MWRSVLGLRSGLGRSAASSCGSRAASRTFAFTNRRLASTQPAHGPKERMTFKRLVKEYGWTATGVYCAFMCVDLPLCFLLVHSAGQSTMEKWEVEVRRLVGADSDPEHTYSRKAATGGKSMFLAEFGIAYLLHKALIVVRVPLTIAITPQVATKLQQWGFKVNRAMPTVDKSQLAAKAADVNSPTVRKVAESIASRDNKAVDEVAKDIVAKSKKAAENGKDYISEAAEQLEKREPRNFGKPAGKGKRWWWFF